MNSAVGGVDNAAKMRVLEYRSLWTVLLRADGIAVSIFDAFMEVFLRMLQKLDLSYGVVQDDDLPQEEGDTILNSHTQVSFLSGRNCGFTAISGTNIRSRTTGLL